MKNTLNDESAFLAHITEDRGGTLFIQTGFEGTAALNDTGETQYKHVTGKEFRPTPPQISHGTCISGAEAWIAAMGNQYRGDADCGCVPRHYSLSIDMSSVQDDSHPAASSRIETMGHTDIPLQFRGDGSFTGEGQMTVTEKGSIRSAILCTTAGTMTFMYKVSGTMEDKSHLLHLTFSTSLLSGSTSGNCSDGARHSHSIPASGVHQNPPFEIPSYMGVVFDVPQPYQNPPEYTSSVKLKIDQRD